MNEVAPTRPWFIITLAVLHWLLAATCVAIAGAAVYMTRNPQVRADKDAAEAIKGLYLGAGVMLIPAVVAAFAGSGLWRGRRWGWVLGLIANVVIAAVFLEEPIFENARWLGEDLAYAAPSLLMIVLLLLPRVYRYVFQSRGVPVGTAATSSGS